MRIRHLALAAALAAGTAGTTLAEAATYTISFENSITGIPYGDVLSFGQTTPLGSQFFGYGIIFSAANGGVGGTVMSEEAFLGGGIAATSGSHFFAYNKGAVYRNGQVASQAPVMIFSDPVASVSAYVAGAALVAYDANFARIGVDYANVAGTRTLNLLEIGATTNKIKYVAFYDRSSLNTVIMDDLTFTRLDKLPVALAAASVPVPGAVWLLAGGLAGLVGRRRRAASGD